MGHKSFIVIAICSIVMSTSCQKKDTASAENSILSVGTHLLVTAGACYSGAGNTTFTNLTASNIVYSINLQNGNREAILADYNSTPSNYGDSPVGLIDAGTSFSVLIENTTTTSLRRIESIDKTSYARTIYSGNTTALSAQLRGMIELPDGYYLVSKSSALEKMKSGLNRLMAGAYPWVNLANPPAASGCAPSVTLLTASAVLNNGNIVFAHAAAGASKIGIVSAQGYSVAGNCLNGGAVIFPPGAAAYPTAMVYDSAKNNLLVAYAGNSTATGVNSIYVYPVNETTNTLGAGVAIYDSSLFGSGSGWNYLLYGVSAMTLDPSDNSLYVATAITTNTTISNFQILKLKYDSTQIGVANNQVLLPVSNPFYSYGFDTKCISSMTITH